MEFTAQFLVIFINLVLICVKDSFSLQMDFPLLAKDFFELNSFHYGTLLACESDVELVKLSRTFYQTTNIRVMIKNLDSDVFQDHESVENVFTDIFHDKKIYKTAIILDVACNQSNQVLKYASEMELFDESHYWLLFGEDLTTIIKLLTPLDLRLDSNVWFVIPGPSSEEPWTIYDFYNPGLKFGGKMVMQFYGLWFSTLQKSTVQSRKFSEKDSKSLIILNESNKSSLKCKTSNTDFECFQNELKPEKVRKQGRWHFYILEDQITQRRDLQGITISSVIAITTRPKSSLLYYLSNPFDLQKDTMHRHNYILYVILMEMYNFKTNILRTNSWGYLQNGSWTGVIGVLMRNEAELGITPTQFKDERFLIVDQTAITWLGRPTILFRHPSKEDGLKDSFTKPLAPNVWWATIAVLALVGVMLRIALQHEAKYMKQDGSQHASEMLEDDSWDYTWILALPGALFQQGLVHSPTIFSGRAISLSLLIFTFMLYQFYSASIVSSLLSEPPRTIITLADLLKSQLKVLIEDIAYNYDFFETTNDQVAIELYKKKVKPTSSLENFVNPAFGLEKVRRGGYAFQVDVAAAYKMIPESFSEREVCDLAEMFLFAPKPLVTITRKHSPYREIITKGLRKIHESGILQYQRAVWHHPRPQCPPSAQGGIGSVTITGVETALLLLVAGAALALFIMLGEIVMARRRRTLK